MSDESLYEKACELYNKLGELEIGGEAQVGLVLIINTDARLGDLQVLLPRYDWIKAIEKKKVGIKMPIQKALKFVDAYRSMAQNPDSCPFSSIKLYEGTIIPKDDSTHGKEWQPDETPPEI